MPSEIGIEKMGINVSTSMGFEKRQFLKKSAKEILKKKGADSDETGRILETIDSVGKEMVYPSVFNSYQAVSQINSDSSLKETLNYLQTHANDKKKKYVFGELWEQFSENKSDDYDYQGELIDFEIDSSLENIFAA